MTSPPQIDARYQLAGIGLRDFIVLVVNTIYQSSLLWIRIHLDHCSSDIHPLLSIIGMLSEDLHTQRSDEATIPNSAFDSSK